MTRAATGDFLVAALRAPLAPDAIRVVTVPAPTGQRESFLPEEGPAVFWTTPGGPVHVGAGAAAQVTAAGPDRFAVLRADAATLWERLDIATHPDLEGDDLPGGRPRLYGGLSFLPGPLPVEWRDFGEATFVLPRLTYATNGQRASLSVAIAGRELDGEGVEGLAAVVAARMDALTEPGGGAGAPETDMDPDTRSPDSGGTDVDAADRASWERAVRSIQARIERGRAEKIVAARSRAVPTAGAGDLPEILRRLGRESATAARFAFRLGGSLFVGATPERLVSRSGRELRTEALAGSVAADSPEREERLLASLKEEAEHDYVVRAIAEALEPVCDRLDRPPEPRVQRLRHVLHLQTPFVGRLREDVHVLELVERLHPTPAVGGWPREEALAWIEAEEPGSRGWYAAPVGWFDATGDGEFGVALRSGLLHPDRAHLYAGAGIVRDSDAAAEFEETEVKLRTMLDALGLLP